MCCLFGLWTKNALTAKEKALATHALATASEARGTDAADLMTVGCGWAKRRTSKDYDHVQVLKSVAESFGLFSWDIEELLSERFIRVKADAGVYLKGCHSCGLSMAKL